VAHGGDAPHRQRVERGRGPVNRNQAITSLK
jgi:hypothetical protein